ncbi:MAG: YeeE/YedE family protein [Methylocystis sp.]
MEILAHAMPLQGFLGGLMLGVAAAIMLLSVGKIAGVSGLLAQTFALVSSKNTNFTAASFIIGIPLGAALVQFFFGPIKSLYPSSLTQLIIAGLLVGFGSRLGSGCTSGHGVCGLSRLSPRSLVATCVFMSVAMATVAMMKHLGLS